MNWQDALEKRIEELQADNTRIENERRHHKARAEAAISLLNAVLVDYPLSEIIGAEQRPVMMARVEEVHAANERLLKDAWCGAANEARAFVKAVEDLDGGDFPAFIEEWRARFKEVTK